MHSVEDFNHSLTPSERRLVSRLTTPFKIQAFLDDIPYSGEERYRCPLTVLRDRKGHCFDGAIFGAAMLRRIGYPPLIVDMLPNKRDDDHLLALYKVDGHWGAVAKSNFAGLRFREPVYRTLRELVMSYLESYFNLRREKTLRRYSRPLDLSRLDRLGWMTAEEDLWVIAEHLVRLPHCPVLDPGMVRRLGRVDRRQFAAGLVGRAE